MERSQDAHHQDHDKIDPQADSGMFCCLQTVLSATQQDPDRFDQPSIDSFHRLLQPLHGETTRKQRARRVGGRSVFHTATKGSI